MTTPNPSPQPTAESAQPTESHCRWCAFAYAPNFSKALDPYRFCSRSCERSKESEEDRRAFSVEQYWQDKQGDDYGTY